MISAESGIDLSGSTRTLIIKSRPTTRSLLRIKLLEKLNLTDSILIIYTLVTLIQLASLTLSNIIELWTASFLLVNLIVITATLLTNYFPYQVLIDEKNQSSQTNVVGFLIAKQKPVVRATPRLILKQHHEPPREANDEASMIDSVFVEHKQHLRSQALSDHSLSFGVDQPSMQSAYRASFGYTAFCIASIFLSIGVRIFHLSSSSSSFKSVLLFIAFSLLFISLGFAAVYFYILKSNRETIYRKNLFYKMLFFPFVQLTIVFFTIFVLLSLSIFAINFFLIEMFVLVIALAVINRIVYFRRLKKLSPKTTANERWENAVGEPLEMNVFTIADTNAYNDSDSDENNDFEVKIDTNKNENIEKAEGLSSKNATKQDVETSSLKKIGSETSNINLLI